MENGELNTTDVIILQNTRNRDPTENKHARQSEKWGRDATAQIARRELCVARSVSSSCPMDVFFSSFYTSDVSDLKKRQGSTPHM